MVAALAVALAGAGAGMVAAAPSASAASSAVYVNMGDSLSSGEGTYAPYQSGTDTSTNKCHRSPNSYSAQYASRSVNSYSLTNVACSGAGVNEIYNSANPNTGGLPDSGEAPQDHALGSATRLVTVSIGINDLNLVGFAANCYQNAIGQSAEDQCFTGIPNLAAYKANLAALPGKLDAAYSDIRSHAPNATVAVVTYPQIYPSTFTGACEEFPTSAGPQWLVTSQAMLNTAHSLISTLNSKIATEVAKYSGFILVDESNALSGHDVCASTQWVNQVNGVSVLHQVADDESLHPNVAGYSALAGVLAGRLDAGHFSSGGIEQNILNAYKADGGPNGLGFPADNGGGYYVHFWGGPGANVEDFSGGSFGPSIIVDGTKGAFFINYGFRTAYISGGWNSTCQSPTDNAYSSGGGTRQDFTGCYMTWTSSTGVVVHPNTCTNYGGTTETGPNACEGFYTTSTWFSGGGVGLFGQEIWTYANGTVKDSTANYTLHGLDTVHAYTLEAYIPNAHSDASHAHYHYCGTNDGCADGYVNQNNFTNAWANFGTVCTTDGNATIQLADDGGDVYPAEVGADAIRAVRTGIIC
jgi:lysophospholipase L1-like esterase